jgi:uncharacterized protein YhdP
LVSKDSVLSINNLQFEGFGVSKKVLSFKGAWDGKHTQLSAKAKGKNLAEFLQRLKVKEKVTGGEFDFDVSLACECAPWNMNYQDITGHLDINVKKGVFTDQDLMESTLSLETNLTLKSGKISSLIRMFLALKCILGKSSGVIFQLPCAR